MSVIVERVETFIQRLNDLDYIISPEAGELLYGDRLNPKERGKSLADYLANSINEYEQKRDSKESEFKAIVCNLWINRAFAQGIVKEGQGLARKLKECRERNIQLESDLEKLSMEYLQLHELTRRVGLPDESDLERDR